MASSSSKKRKGKIAQNYNVPKFKSLLHEDHYSKYTKFKDVLLEAQIEVDAPEFAPMRAQINLRKWQRLTKPIQVVGYSLVREFYTNPWVMESEDIQVDEIIAEQIYKFAKKTGIRTKLPFPRVIQRLCNEAKVSIPEDTVIPVEPHINSKCMERVRKERAGRREAPPPEQQNEEAAEIPQAPPI
ncbi:hypothetical protein PIB30_069343 [Stylosanthes scabra]|uniref:Uncharacterized protein n=1 Tax=Stylosanthes scabra TaxID=79078 RepID=A0ABU6UM14_9FABA|nr:hypothetical protein [Stylosanthes scabra]